MVDGQMDTQTDKTAKISAALSTTLLQRYLPAVTEILQLQSVTVMHTDRMNFKKCTAKQKS